MRGLILGLAGAALALSACANTRGSWGCDASRGAPCRSIAAQDAAAAPPGAGRPPAIAGGEPLRWWAAGDAVAGTFAEMPRREPDQIIRVLVAGWTDASGDFHGPSEIYAVMRRGGWWVAPPVTPLALPRTRPSPPTSPTSPAPPAASAPAPGGAPPEDAP